MVLEQRGDWHKTESGCLWMLLVMDLNPVASLKVLKMEIWHRVDL